MKYAIYGGSFDPVHKGHEAVVKAALQELDIEKLFVVPTFLNPFKSTSFAPANLRLEWLRELFKDEPKVVVSDFETVQNRSVTTIESVKHFKVGCDQIYLIIGADNLKSLDQWNSINELNRVVTWVVATRDKIEIDESFRVLDVDEPISSSTVRENMSEDMLPCAISKQIIKYYKEKNAKN